MFERCLQKITKSCRFLTMGLFFGYFSDAAALELVVEDQHGGKLANAVIELHYNAEQLAKPNLPVATMDQVHKQFLPELLVVQKGQQVDFPNSDNIRHHVYSFSQAKPFQLKLYSGQPKAPITFDNQGVVVLGCNIHDSMVGYIYVAGSKHVYKTNKQGKVTLPNNLLPIELSVWHALQTAPLENKKIITVSAKSKHTITVNTSTPAPRNTFGSKFKAGNDS